MHKKLNFKSSDQNFKKSLSKFLPYDIAVIYEDLDRDEKNRIIENVSPKFLSDLFVELDLDEKLDLFDILTEHKRKQLLRNIESDDLKEFIEDLNEEEKEHIFAYLSQVKKKTIELLLTYEEDAVASIMTTDFFKINSNLSIKEATNIVITKSGDNDYIDTIFIVDEDEKLVGTIDIKTLIIARENQKLLDLLSDDYQYLDEFDGIEKAIQVVRDYDRNAVPVVDKDLKLIGVVTADDIFDELIEDLEDDYQRMALLADHESSLTSFERSKQRLPWLMIAVVLNLLIASFLSIFERTLAEVVALVLFQPLILGMAGNIGTQALAVTIIGLHKDEYIDVKVQKKHIVKEIFVGLLNSILLAVASFVFAVAFLNVAPTGSQEPLLIGFVVLVAVGSSMFISAAIGVLIPMILNKYKIDPAAASGPIMTTINDVVALVIYFGVATLMFL